MIKRSILLAEDDEDDQQFFQNFLQNRSDIALLPIAENGVVLIDFLEEIKDGAGLPDFIILDQNMPKMNGLQTLKTLKESSRYAHIPVMLYSTYTDDTLIKTGSDLGACLVMVKPITKEGYDKLITEFLKCMSQQTE